MAGILLENVALVSLQPPLASSLNPAGFISLKITVWIFFFFFIFLAFLACLLLGGRGLRQCLGKSSWQLHSSLRPKDFFSYHPP